MIEAARGKPHPENVRFLRAGLEEHGRYGKDPFEGIACIGNTLPHLPDRDTVAAALRAFRAASVPGVQLIIQIVNMDRALREMPYRLPDLKAEGVTMERHYLDTCDPGYLVFRTVLTVRDVPCVTGYGDDVTGYGDDVTESAITLLALRREELSGMAAAAGFSEQLWFGSYAGEPWQDDSPLTILSARPR